MQAGAGRSATMRSMAVDGEALRQLEDRLRRARERLDRLESRAERAGDLQEVVLVGEHVGVPAPAASRHVLFVPSPQGYRLVEREGPPPGVGDIVVPAEGAPDHVVTRVAASTVPGDRRPCAYLQLT